ncbi:MAG: HAMP domain-containing sensor histidine kinase [Flavipsychrobacter sp.]|nr:HAMP domain-containing sensor histidine kinase [Flavipsychrobacter sp.]
MKLSAHYNRSNIIITVSVLLVGAVIYYFAINYIIQRQLDRDLTEEMEEIVSYIGSRHKFPVQLDIDQEDVSFNETNQSNFKTVYFNAPFRKSIKKDSDDDNNGRAVETLVHVNGKSYLMTIVISRESTEYLVQVIATITLILMVGLFLVLLLTNRYVSHDLWKPFFYLLQQLKAFSVSDHTNFSYSKTNVDEFNELEAAVLLMSSRVRKDYRTLKQFTENASHEMMTPLSVITSKLDILIQDDSLNPEHYKQLQDIYGATNKLSRLNQSLLLLVKIENNLIGETELLELDQLVLEKSEQFQELITSKHITVTTAIAQKTVTASGQLLDILFNNLFSNAIRHNIDSGVINISLTDEGFLIQNTGSLHPLNEEELFERFLKGKNSEGAGLGLAIVKSICNVYNWEVSYSFISSLHTFQILFAPGKV